jgi:hypothetical protein
MGKQLSPSLVVLVIACTSTWKAHAFFQYCGYGPPAATIPPPYSTLFCRADINAFDLLNGDHLHQDTFVGAATGEAILVIGARTSTWAYHPSLTTTNHWVRRGPSMPVGGYLISSEWTGLKLGQIYEGPKASSFVAPLGPP